MPFSKNLIIVDVMAGLSPCHFFCVKPFIVPLNIYEGSIKGLISSLLVVEWVPPGMTMPDPAAPTPIVGYDDPFMPCRQALQCDIMSISLQNMIFPLYKFMKQ